MIIEYSRFLVPVVYLVPATIAFYLWLLLREKARQSAGGINYPKVLSYLCFAEGVHNAYYFVATLVRIVDEDVYEGMMLPVPWLFAQGVIAAAFSVLFLYFVRNRHIEIGDVRREKELAEQFRELSRIDPLTGLNNRRGLDEILAREKVRSDRMLRPFSLMMIDLDRFKSYNDSYGHQRGDRLLHQIADHVRVSIRREIDIPFRYGGDELLIIMPETNATVAQVIASRLREAIKQLTNGFVTVSIGIFEIPPGFSMKTEEMITKVDKAMYDAKNRGGDQVTCFAC